MSFKNKYNLIFGIVVLMRNDLLTGDRPGSEEASWYRIGIIIIVITTFFPQIKFMFLVSRQGKVRLSRWYDSYTLKERQTLLKDVGPMVLARKGRLCNFIEYKGNCCYM